MEFRVGRCATVIMKRGIISRSEAMQQHNIEVIKYIGEGYKYLDILETDKLKTLEREKVTKEYFCGKQKNLKSELNSDNVVKTIRSRKAAVIRYGQGLIKRTKVESRTIERQEKR